MILSTNNAIPTYLPADTSSFIYTVQAESLNTHLFSPVFKMPKFLQC